MEKMLLGEITTACSGILIGDANIPIDKISTDSRDIHGGELFIPLKGVTFDGHEYIDMAIKSGARAVLSSIKLPYENYILVEDTMLAMHKIAKHYKNKFHIPCIAITGSVGKTTTKEMVVSVLKEKYNVHKNKGNFNNAIGLPLTVFDLNSEHEIAVFEMGTNQVGEIATLEEIIRPDTAIISNIGTAHIENLGSREGILKEKSDIFRHFTANNTAIINGDNDILRSFVSDVFHIIKYGLNEGNNLVAINIEEKGEKGISFDLILYGKKETFDISLPGIHNVYNALSAIAIGLLYEVDIEGIKRGLFHFEPAQQRMDIFEIKNNIKIINDTYNANPESMRATIDVISNIANGKEKVCVLGDMLELGDISKEQHYELGRYLVKKKIDILITLGECAKEIAHGAKDMGMDEKNIYTFSTNEEILLNIYDIISENSVLLIKGSRSMFMEKIVEALKKDV